MITLSNNNGYAMLMITFAWEKNYIWNSHTLAQLNTNTQARPTSIKQGPVYSIEMLWVGLPTCFKSFLSFSAIGKVNQTHHKSDYNEVD